MSRRVAPAHPLFADPGYAPLKRFIIESTGLAYYADKDQDLAGRIGKRLAHLRIPDCHAYLARLTHAGDGESEKHHLVEELTIGETYFFRHIEQLDALCTLVFSDAIERNRAVRALRIWCAGCATGAEPYSVAILLKRHFADRLDGWNVRILGTDINRAFLAAAERGVFDERALRSTPDDIRRRWFSPSGNRWTVDERLREWVTFQPHNLLERPYPQVPGSVDVILCRNVMIYFDWAAIRQILGHFHESLVDGGWLAAGHAESNTELFGAFRTVNAPGATLYQKSGGAALTPVDVPVQMPDRAWAPAPLDVALWSPPSLPALPVHPPMAPPPPDPDMRPAALALVRRLANEGQWTDAVRTCDRALERDPRNAMLHFYRGLIADQMGQAAVAERSLREAVAIDRRFVLAHYHLALLLDKRGRRDDALRSLTTVVTLASAMAPDVEVSDGDGITANDLRELAGTHLGLMAR